MTPVLERCEKGKERIENVDKGQARITEEEVNGSLLLSLPKHLIFDILARLPICTLLICKHVCNTFENILSDPDYTHLAKASLDDHHLVIQEVNNPLKCFLTPLITLDKHAQTNEHYDGNFLPWHTLTIPYIIPKAKKSNGQAAYLVGSCNGLLCLHYCVNEVNSFCVCNPILGEFTVLPRFKEFALEFGGFGFCPKTKKYKVLRFIPSYGYCDILTLGTDDDWRRISDSPPYPRSSFKGIFISFCGNLHWTVSKISICSFTLETEQYSYISLPSDLSDAFQIGTLDGLFCVGCIRFRGEFYVYVMEDYEVKSSWIKKISIVMEFNFRGVGETISTVTFLDNGVLVLHCNTHLVYYDTRKGTRSHERFDGDYCATVHIPSLMSLKDIVRRENVVLVEQNMLPIVSS